MSFLDVLFADFKTTPYAHQAEEFEVSAEMPSRALLWSMRTGKTKVIIDTACHLYREGKIDCVLIIAPNGVHENWIRRELPIHHWDSVPYTTSIWRTAVAGSSTVYPKLHKAWWNLADLMLIGDELCWFSFNSEIIIRDDVKRLLMRILRRKRVMLVVDESHDFRVPGSKRTKRIRGLAKKCAYRRILTGTPVTNTPLHAYSQFEILEPGVLGYTRYSDFENRYAVYEQRTQKSGRKYPVLVDYQNLEELKANIERRSSIILREDCKDLPDLVRSTRAVDLTEAQTKAYKDLHDSYMIDVGRERVSVGENTMRLIKLQQIVSGFLIDEYGDVHDIEGDNPRLEAISDEVYLTPGKVIIWCHFREDIARVVERLRIDGHSVVQYHGGTSDFERSTARKLFESGAENSVKALVGHPRSGGQGVNLAAADKIIWYSHTFDAIVREQANERATEIGGGNVQIVDFVAPGIDEYIIKSLDKKVSIAGELIQSQMQDILKGTNI